MSQRQPQPPATPQAFQESINELLNELAFQNVLLSSIDDSVENRKEAEAEVRAEITTLEKQLRALKRGSRSIALNSSSPTHKDTEATSSSQSFSSPHSEGTPDGPMDDSPATLSSPGGAGEQWHLAHSTTSTELSMDSSDSVAEFPTPSKMSLPTRKRSYSEHLDVSTRYAERKSRRTSPTSYTMSPTTPSSTSGDDEFSMLDSEILEQQKAEEAKIIREKSDEEFARSLLNSGHESTTVPKLSAFDLMSGMRPPPSGSPSTLSWGKLESGHSLSTNFGKASKASESSKMMFAPYKSDRDKLFTDQKAVLSSSHTMPGAFPDDSGDDDADIEIISLSQFNDNEKGAPARSENARHFNQASANSTVRTPMFGKHSVPSWMSGSIRGSESMSAQWSNKSLTNIPFSAPPKMRFPDPKTFADPGNFSKSHNGVSSSASTATGMYTNYTGFSNYGIQNGRPVTEYDPAVTEYDPPVTEYDPQSVMRMSIPGSSQLRRTSSNHGLLGPLATSLGYGDANHEIFNESFNERLAGQLDYIINDPRKTDEEIKALIENIRPDEDLPAEDREGTPEGLKYALYEHQKLALTWLRSMEESKNKAAILADDMGLGKTISSIALILSRPSTDRLRKTTLIVGPVALIRQWEREIRKKVRFDHRLSTHIVHGGRKLSWDELRTYDVVLTTYNTLAAEYKRWEKFLANQHAEGRLHEREIDEGPLRRKFPLLGPKSLFYRVILDEAQCIKNKSTVSARAAYHLKSMTRICLTGTPMMNNVGELYSLIHFLRIRPYNDYRKFQADFGMLTKGNLNQRDSDKAMRKLQALLKAVLLRRTKTSLIDGKPIITLPPKTEEITHVVFSEDEQSFYSALEGKSRIQFNKYMRANTVGKNYSNILVLLLRLRQCCCHPHLITDFEEAPPAGLGDLTEEAMNMLAESLTPDVVSRISAAESFECPVCYDAVDNPVIVIPCGHDTCSECLTRISDQANQQNVINGDEASGTSKCPSCRGKIEKNKVIDYATFKKVHMKGADVAEDKDELGSNNSDSDNDGSEIDSDSDEDKHGDVDGNGNLRDFIVPDGLETDEAIGNNKAVGADGNGYLKRVSDKRSESINNKREGKDRGRANRTNKKKKSKKHFSIAMLKKEASKSAAGRRRYLSYLRKNWQPSAKVNKCVELLERFQNDNQKTIVFSQFVSLLDLLQVPILEKGWTCERYDGSMDADARNDAINRFTDDSNTRVMLISLKAGNAGLNLVAASRVIILDPFWNPFIEMQAVDRAHRIGQQRPVEVHRILIQGTVEDRIIELQQRKKRLVEEALSEGASKSLGRLGVKELAFLFGVGSSS